MIDIGDIIGVTGKVRRTKRGELTINAEEITMLTKSLLPMPEKWNGISDVEIRYRKRHLDILSNEESKLRFQQRSKIISGIRRFMEAEGFLEVETPMLQTVYGGANRRSVQDLPQHAEDGNVSAHRAGTVPEAHAGVRPVRQGLRGQPQLPQ